MPKIESRKRWDAEVEVEIENLALAVQYVEAGRGSEQKRYLVPTDWLAEDKETIVFDVGKRLKGWLKEVVATMKPSMKDRVQYGIAVKSLPKVGHVPIAKLSDIRPSKTWHSFAKKDIYDLNKLPEPDVEVILTQDKMKSTIFALHYVLNKPVTAKAVIYCLGVSGLHPTSIQQWLEMLGSLKGLGDMHNAGYGCFTVKSFKVIKEVELKF